MSLQRLYRRWLRWRRRSLQEQLYVVERRLAKTQRRVSGL